MPVYEYSCVCGALTTKVLKVADHCNMMPCDACGQPAPQRLCAPMVAIDYPEYISPATGKLIRGKRQHIEDLKASGCRILEPGETEQFIRDKEKRRDEHFTKLADQVIAEVAPTISS